LCQEEFEALQRFEIVENIFIILNFGFVIVINQ